VLLKPRTVAEACDMLREHAGEALPLAGGTALEVLRRLGLLGSPPLVDLAGLAELRGIGRANGDVRLGACATLREVERDPLVAAHVPLLRETYRRVANVRVRGAATVGGNLAYADHRIDPPSALLVLDARVRLRSVSAEREVRLREFFRDLEVTALEDGELLTDVLVPVPPPGARGAFRKLVSLAENDWPCAGVAALLTPGDGQGLRLDLGLTALAPTPRHTQLDVSGLGLEAAQDAAEAAAAPLLAPIEDFRGSRAYKERVGQVAVREAVEAAWRR
jgi:carbon-monoxide dehydrogenase medium subunit